VSYVYPSRDLVLTLLLASDTPIFFLRDPAKFPLFIHTQKVGTILLLFV
jgi:hypothetical protein